MGPEDRIDPQPSGEGGLVDIVRLISNELGVSQQVARSQVAMGSVSVDGNLWEGDRFTIPYNFLLNKVLIVIGPDRRFRVHFRG